MALEAAGEGAEGWVLLDDVEAALEAAWAPDMSYPDALAAIHPLRSTPPTAPAVPDSAVKLAVEAVEGLANGFLPGGPEDMKGAFRRIATAIRALSALPAQPNSSETRPSFDEVRAKAMAAVKDLNDWCHVNEAEWTGWGDGDVPVSAEWWRVKSGQALKALDEVRKPLATNPEPKR